MPGLLVRMPDRNGLKAHSSTYSRSDGGLKLNSSHSTPLPPSESLTLLRFTSVASGSGVAAIAFSSRGAIAARKCRQRRVDRKRIFSRRQRHQVLIGLVTCRETDTGPALRRSARAADRDRAPGRLPAPVWSSSPKASCSRWSRILRFSSVFCL